MSSASRSPVPRPSPWLRWSLGEVAVEATPRYLRVEVKTIRKSHHQTPAQVHQVRQCDRLPQLLGAPLRLPAARDPAAAKLTLPPRQN